MKKDNIGVICLKGTENIAKHLSEYLIYCEILRFKTGEAKAILKENIKYKQIYILVDVCNNSIEYEINNYKNHMSPDDYYQDLKRVIDVVKKQTDKIIIIMPYLYEGRQVKRFLDESSDCCMFLNELFNLGINSIITFDAHDSNIKNMVSSNKIQSIKTGYYLLKGLFDEVKDLDINSDNLIIVSPDKGAIERSKYISEVLKVNFGFFEKRRDYTEIVSCEYHGDSVYNKDIIIIDDMISSGETILTAAEKLKQKNAKRIFVLCSFGLFTNGLKNFDEAYKKGIINKIITTNLTYQKSELFTKLYYKCIDMSEKIADLIFEINTGKNINDLDFCDYELINLIDKYKNYQK